MSDDGRASPGSDSRRSPLPAQPRLWRCLAWRRRRRPWRLKFYRLSADMSTSYSDLCTTMEAPTRGRTRTITEQRSHRLTGFGIPSSARCLNDAECNVLPSLIKHDFLGWTSAEELLHNPLACIPSLDQPAAVRDKRSVWSVVTAVRILMNLAFEPRMRMWRPCRPLTCLQCIFCLAKRRQRPSIRDVLNPSRFLQLTS